MNKEKGKDKEQKRAKSAKQAKNDSDDSDIEDEVVGGREISGVYIPPPPVAFCSVENIGPRLIITQIVNENFKSYAGKQVLGPFHKNFTSIIGPNGSGKSNVIDSMLFVFGYRATKIRSKKLSVLIHKSENHKNLRSCTVEVHFVKIIDKGDNDYEIVPKSDIIIGRTATIENQSYYTINGKNARFKQVAMLLRSHGIDLVHNRFLILQGEVEQIAMMKPKAQNEHETGMLEYLEDIIGTTRYKVPLQQLETKLEELTRDKNEKYQRVRAVDKEKESLAEPMEEAVRFLIKENEYFVLQSKLNQYYLHEHTKILNEHLAEKAAAENLVKEVKENLKTFGEELSKKEKQIGLKIKELETLKTRREQLKDSVSKSDKQSNELKLDIGHANTKRKKTIETKKQLEQKLITIKNIPEKNAKEIEELKKVQQKLTLARTEEEAVVEKTLASLRLETEELQDNLTQMSNKLLGLKNITDAANEKYEVAKTELDVYTNKEAKEKQKMEQLKTSLDSVSNKLNAEQNKASEASQNLPNAEERLPIAERELHQVKQREATVRQEMNILAIKTQEKRNHIKDIKRRNHVVDFIMQQKAKGVVPGVFGRLGDLGGIDSKYDCAVSTACGALDYIVTDTVRTATTCVDLLRDHDVGRSYFIMLEKIQDLKSEYARKIQTPENIPRLFDLITMQDERVRPAFYFACRDTLVAENLPQATRCAYGATRHRVVTLNGDIIEISGTISGGGREKKTGRIGRSATVITDGSSADDVRIMDEQMTKLKEEYTQLQQKRGSLEREIATLNGDIKKWKSVLQSSEIGIKELMRQEQQLSQQIRNQEGIIVAAAVDPQVIKEMTEKLETLKKEYDIAAKNSGEVEIEVKKLKSKIDAATGGKMKEVRQKLEKTTTQLNKVTAEITKLGVEIKGAARDEVKTTNRITSLTSDINENEATIEKAEAKHKALAENLTKFAKELEVVNSDASAQEEVVRKMKSETSELTKKISALKATKLTEVQKMESIEKNIKEQESAINGRKKFLAGIKFNQIPNQEDDTPKEIVMYTPEDIESFDIEKLNYHHTQMNELLNQSRETVNLRSIEDYNEKVALLATRSKELEAAIALKNEVRQGFDEVRKARLHEFMVGFTIIGGKLKEMYQMITLGGDAEFDLMDGLDPFAEGIMFSVRPPKKSWKNINNLSGGEKTLSSLALVFALHYYRPSPLYVMDEIDAALDFKNVSIVGNYIKERTKNAQFIIISLRSNMFELADVLIGIYKTYNCTKSVSVYPDLHSDDKNEEAKQEEQEPEANMSSPPPKRSRADSNRSSKDSIKKEFSPKKMKTKHSKA